MKCCIQSCVNSGKVKKINPSSSSPSPRITYHFFPKDPNQQEAWLESLGQPNLMLTYRTMICSEHFEEDDFYLTKQGTRRIKYGAVPRMKGDAYEPAASRVCKLCLAVDNRMYDIRDHGLTQMYKDVLGYLPRTDALNRLPMGICWQCTARLQSAATFRSKALFCDEVLQDHLEVNADLKIIDIQNIVKHEINLKSSITIQEVFKFNSHNIQEYAPNTYMKTEVIDIPFKEKSDAEVENLIIDKITTNDKRKNELTVKKIPNPILKTQENLIHTTKIKMAEDDTSCDDDDLSFDGEMETKKEYIDKISKVDDLSDNDEDETVAKKVYIDNIRKRIEEVLKSDDELESMDIDDYDDDDDDKDDDEKSIVSDDEELKTKRTKKTDKTVKIKPSKRKKKNSAANTKKDSVVKKKAKKKTNPNHLIDEKVFTVKELNHEELKREVLARRDSEKYKYATYKCDVCYRGFKAKENRERHMIKHSKKSGPYKCEICHIRTTKPMYLSKHMYGAHSLEFQCKLCPFITRLRTVAADHIKYHAGNKYKCPKCPVEFERPTTLQNHLRLQHMSPFVCELCGYTFVNERGVHVHKRISHKLFDENTVFKGPHCDVCDVKFLSDKAYNTHLRLSSKHITEDDPERIKNDYTITPRRFTAPIMVNTDTRPVIRRRMRNAADSEPLNCEQCGAVQSGFRAYAMHFKHAHPGVSRKQLLAASPYMCEHCGKLFLTATLLASHMWVHTGKKQFQCDVCQKAFSTKASLAGHISQHEGFPRSFSCPECGRHFTARYNLTRHIMVVHVGLRPYKCDVCSKVFGTLVELRQHVDHVHLRKPRPKRVRRQPIKTEISDEDS